MTQAVSRLLVRGLTAPLVYKRLILTLTYRRPYIGVH